MFSKIFIYYTHIYAYESFSTTFDKDLRKNIKKRRDREIREHKLNESTEYEIGKVKQTRKK